MLGRFGKTKSNTTTPDLIVESDAEVDAKIESTENTLAPEQAIRSPLVDEKVKIHSKLIEQLNLTSLENMSPEQLVGAIAGFVSDHVHEARIVLNQTELEAFTREIVDEMTGLGPIEPLLKDPTVTDILINGPNKVFVERFGLLEPTKVNFKDEPHLLRIIGKIVAAVGRRVDETTPMVDARLLDGSRVNVAIRPVALDGPLVSIRKFAKQSFSMERLIEVDSIHPFIADLLRLAVKGRTSIIVSGGTGSGKTTMLNALSTYIPQKERLVTIEDSAELQLQQLHVARMETRPPNAEGRGEIKQRDLLRNALRMRPDRIIIGECRGEEAYDMLQAMNTGHEGSMTTIHANSPRDAVRRLEQMIGMASNTMSQLSIRQQIASAIHVFIQLQRLADGKRRLTSFTEVTGMEGEVVQMQEIFRFQKEGVDAEGQIIGSFQATGVRPGFLSEFITLGEEIPAYYFNAGRLKK